MEYFESVPFEEMANWLSQPREIQTLGRRSSFTASCSMKNTIHIVGSRGSAADIDRAYWNYVSQVIDSVVPADRHLTTNYNQLHGYYFAPSIPALCRAYCESKK